MCHRQFMTSSIVVLIVVLLSHGVLSITTISPETLEEETERILQRHNLYRECHDAPPLEINSKLSAVAQEEANALAGNKTRKHLKLQNTFDGFNIYIKPPTPRLSAFAASDEDFNPVDIWYQEGRHYRPGDYSYIADHFTQLIWKSTKQLGVGMAESSDGVLYIVCKYDPVGNVDGQYDENILPVNKNSPAFQEGVCLPETFMNLDDEADEGSTPMFTSTLSSLNETGCRKNITDFEKETNITDTSEQMYARTITALYFVIVLSVFSMIVSTCLAAAIMFTVYKIFKCNPCADNKDSLSCGPSTQRSCTVTTRDCRDSPRQDGQQESLSTSYNCSSYM